MHLFKIIKGGVCTFNVHEIELAVDTGCKFYVDDHGAVIVEHKGRLATACKHSKEVFRTGEEAAAAHTKLKIDELTAQKKEIIEELKRLKS